MSAISESARGEVCQLRIPNVCSHDPEQTVWAHNNGMSAGRGFSKKSLLLCGAYACFHCHNVYDRRVPTPAGMTRQDVENCFAEAHYRSLVMLNIKGLV